ncbi:MAG TPA: translation initiation factor IF-2 N-terminal domain-containing protein, partial [Thermoanaerobaculia bacterium]|nr:translation initiation factor IF-2 N-terminal domain-containing protein [Thermoanaerobaculia bacterium]
MKPTAAKFTVTQLAKMMGKPPKEVLFLLQGIGVDVKTPDSVLDAATASALLAGKTQAPKTLIVRQAPTAPSAAALATAAAAKAKTERAALKRIKIVEKTAEGEAETAEAGEFTEAAAQAPAAAEAAAPASTRADAGAE